VAGPTQFYRTVIAVLKGANVPFLVGGAYALSTYTRINKRTKDLDLMIRRLDWPDVARALRGAGILARLSYPHWLGKAQSNGALVDIIFSSGNGGCEVDAGWFEQAPTARILDSVVLLAPPEELIWSKAFVMERERFDGADVLHLVRALAEILDWRRLRDRFSGHEEVLLSHLVLFRYAYPGEADRVPGELLRELFGIVDGRPARRTKLCRGTLLSRAQYLVDVSAGGLIDARRPPFGRLSRRELQIWTRGIDRVPQRQRKSDTPAGRATALPEGAAKISTLP
jgi:hypothetical protein